MTFQLARRAPHQRGFVLVLTLWVLVIVALSVAYFSQRVSDAVALAQQSRLNTQGLIDMAGTRAELLYRMGTTSLTATGLGIGGAAMALDNRAYRGQGDTLVRLQDTRGLINLNYIDDNRLQRFLGILGIPAERRSRLLDTLHDYIDPDNLRRLNGAEKDDYQALGLPPPANNNLTSPWQAKRIIGWRDAPVLWQANRLPELTTTSMGMGLNPNTAPAEVLATLPSFSADIAQRVIASRQLQPITSTTQLAAIAGVDASQFDDNLSTLPSNTIRITQAILQTPWAIQYNVTLTPNGENAPWLIDVYGRISSTPNVATSPDLPPLPVRSSSAPENAPL
jgi:type II secretory pathway component PulK